MPDYVVVGDPIRCELGEGLWWSARSNAVYWVDIYGQRVHRIDLASGRTQSWDVPEKIGWLVERRDHPGFIAGLQGGFTELTLEPFSLRRLAAPEPHLPRNRMNDCCVDAEGRIWAGTMDAAIEHPTGSLYRFNAEHRVTKLDEGYLVTNGPVFDVARKRVYHNDTGKGVVYCFDRTPEGDIRNRHEFIRFPSEWGVPDGMTLDAQGGLWIAHYGGGCISRFNAEGRRERSIQLPASQITNVVFAGVNVDRMFVTSASAGLTDEPLAGALFEVDPGGVTGVAPNLFAG